MFIKYIKEISLKKILKRSLHNVKPSLLTTPILTVGLVIDESYFSDKEQLTKELVACGVKESNIKMIVFRDKIKKNETFSQPTFSNNDMSWKGTLSPIFVKDFINIPFDMLISYYDTEKAPLLLITNHSKALFKVGFSTVDKRLNHLMINTNAENYKVFVHELFRYLKILNKI
ncbi:hypothetical protein SL053_001656 [Flavobacterium psychrophilum]|nr:hypothetical protein [Flavobacterium psychrophilum]AIN74394.1 hypothetical protein FPG3_08850 [Flavobacterium psychrophilum FPG3]EKT2070018.1 hypothetical protein [Flavobacterium psychrophilum]EKT2072176.1 hypothetical protein [Flavobacterium psychrophilum]EKT3956271.1 hypothetical protein [Flavobacterium psychrophilum]EKT3965185.1 hypothetical protein [Flavobacterium psychrophilum]